MDIVKAFNGDMIDMGECMGCTKANAHNNPAINPGEIVRTRNFDISQDFELPINGFIVIGSIRHIESINEMTSEEKQELITLIDVVTASLKKLGVCPQYDVVWEEKPGNHFHVWLMPRHQYLLDAMGVNIIKEVGRLFAYAKQNLRTPENLAAINATIQNLKTELQSNETLKDILI